MHSISPEQTGRKPIVLITGCGSGLGLSLVRRFCADGSFRVVATARGSDSVRSLKDEFGERPDLMIRQLDVTDDIQRGQVVAEIYSNWRALDILINNAGISYRSVIEHMDEEAEKHQLDVNYLGPLALVRLVVPGMRERGYGKIINISSVSGMVGMPTMASYSASKHALEGATEALWYELRPFGIQVSLVQPGFIRSNSFQRVYFSRKAKLSEALEGPYSEYYQNMGPFVARLMHLSLVTPDQIANRILKLCQRKSAPLWIPVTPDAAVFYWLRKFLPREAFHRLMSKFLPGQKSWGEKFKKSSRRTHLYHWYQDRRGSQHS